MTYSDTRSAVTVRATHHGTTATAATHYETLALAPTSPSSSSAVSILVPLIHHLAPSYRMLDSPTPHNHNFRLIPDHPLSTSLSLCGPYRSPTCTGTITYGWAGYRAVVVRVRGGGDCHVWSCQTVSTCFPQRWSLRLRL